MKRQARDIGGTKKKRSGIEGTMRQKDRGTGGSREDKKLKNKASPLDGSSHSLWMDRWSNAFRDHSPCQFLRLFISSPFPRPKKNMTKEVPEISIDRFSKDGRRRERSKKTCVSETGSKENETERKEWDSMTSKRSAKLLARIGSKRYRICVGSILPRATWIERGIRVQCLAQRKSPRRHHVLPKRIPRL